MTAGRGRRGGVLLQVLVTAAIAGLLCASMMHSRFQPALSAANAVTRVQDDLAGQAAIARVQQVWMAGGSCSSDAAAGVACSGSGCACECAVAGVTVTSTANGGACALTTNRSEAP